MDKQDTKFCRFCNSDHPLTTDFWYFKKTVKGNTTYRCKKRDLDTFHVWTANNQGHRDQYVKDYERKNRRSRTQKRIERYRDDPSFRIACCLRSRLRDIAKPGKKVGSAVRDLGCTLDELKVYLESKFQPGMSWDNYGSGGWHIDHVVPLSWFDLTNREQFLVANHYTNLYPMWAEDNLSKGARYLDDNKEK